MISRFKKLLFLISGKGRFKFFILLAAMFINSLLEMIGVGSIPVFILIISNPEKIMQHQWAAPFVGLFDITTSKSLLTWGAVFLIGLFVAKNVFLSLLIYIKTRIIYNEQVRLGNRLFKAYMKASYPFFLNRNSAELLRNVNNETRLIISGVILPLLQTVLDGLVLVMIVILLMAVEPVVSLLAFAILGSVSFIFIRFTNKKNKAYGKEARQHRRRMNKIVLEGISGIKDIIVMGRENSFLSRYNFSAVRTAITLRYKQMISQLPKPFMETIAVVGMLLIVLMLLVLGRDINSLLPVLTLFAVAAMRLLPVLKDIVAAYTDIRYNVYAIDPVYNDLKLLEKDADRQLKKEKKIDITPYPFVSEIVFKNVSYRYPQGNVQAVRNINLNIPKGAVVGLVGPSGAGKTTLVDILLGLLKPQEGKVLADKQDIFADVRRWRKNVGYIPQFIHLNDDTIRRNIAFGLPDDEIDEALVWEAINASQLEEFVRELPKGLDTVVGERGTRLSGGQRQRIGIARALYGNPPVLIMDEATSALDNITEKYVIDALDKLRGDRTIIIIAHRLTTVRNCDVVYLMNEGRILEQGSYEYLLKSSKEFRKMNLVE
ncbi:MAG TPA: ABC transporter ATP-binding protein [Deltaproteobacteria bacterium]|nr:ABC transporter ATP-binding protein [Deltaproteobacteria bacterium]